MEALKWGDTKPFYGWLSEVTTTGQSPLRAHGQLYSERQSCVDPGSDYRLTI